MGRVSGVSREPFIIFLDVELRANVFLSPLDDIRESRISGFHGLFVRIYLDRGQAARSLA